MSTEAPTSGATQSADQKSKSTGLNQEELAFVNLMDQYYSTHQMLMTDDEAVKNYMFDRDEFNALIGNPKVLVALHERDVIKGGQAIGNKTVPLDPSNLGSGLSTEAVAEWQTKGLTAVQLIVANQMLDLIDTRSYKKKLQDNGISTLRWDKWMNDPVFSNYMRERAESMLGQNMHEAHLSLIDKVRNGDPKMLQLYYEITGRFVTQTGAGGGQNFNIETLLVDILEVINDNVSDYDTMVKISDGIKGLITRRKAVGDLMEAYSDDPIVVPEIMPARPLTPKLQEIAERTAEADKPQIEDV